MQFILTYAVLIACTSLPQIGNMYLNFNRNLFFIMFPYFHFITQLSAYESGVIFLVSRKEQSSGSWYWSNSLNRWKGLPFIKQSLKSSNANNKLSCNIAVFRLTVAIPYCLWLHDFLYIALLIHRDWSWSKLASRSKNQPTNQIKPIKNLQTLKPPLN